MRRWIRSYFIDPWPEPDEGAWGERFAYVYVVPGMILAATVAVAGSRVGIVLGPLGLASAIGLAMHAVFKTADWRY